MQYIHRSDVKVHGCLKSSNVVIDSRLVCKVTDFGLIKFKAGRKHPEDAGRDYCHRRKGFDGFLQRSFNLPSFCSKL